MHLKLHNASSEKVTLQTNDLAVVLVTQSPFPNSAINYKDPHDQAYWLYHYSFRPLKPADQQLRVACRQILIPTLLHDLTQIENKHPFSNELISLEPFGTMTDEITVGKELLPGEYEIFFYITSGNFSYPPGPMSARIPFDIVETK
ncbi:MAG: hypothetical protein C4527_29150 [Candidatus Omnitrophota bacterium]|nr:MAG: hypothetical protein C4527_29150 [Candidatus Omnitrophota bacterium]